MCVLEMEDPAPAIARDGSRLPLRTRMLLVGLDRINRGLEPSAPEKVARILSFEGNLSPEEAKWLERRRGRK